MNTNTYEEEIRRMYSDAGLDFDADLLYYSSHGYVFRDLDFFLMGCCVEGRGWHIQAAAGNIFCCLLLNAIVFLYTLNILNILNIILKQIERSFK